MGGNGKEWVDLVSMQNLISMIKTAIFSHISKSMKILFKQFVNPFFYFPYPAVTGKSKSSIQMLSWLQAIGVKVFFGIYPLHETIYFWRNDSENSILFLSGILESVHSMYDASNEQVFIVTRFKSSDRKNHGRTVKETRCSDEFHTC